MPQATPVRPTDAEFLARALPDNTIIAFEADEHELDTRKNPSRLGP
jgi:hypothetical protein